MGDFYHNRIILIAVLLAGMGPSSMVGLLPSAEGSTWELALRLNASDFLSVNEVFLVELPDPAGSATIYVSGHPLFVTHDPKEFSISMKAYVPYTKFFDCVAEIDFSGSAPITITDQGAFALGRSLENHSKWTCFLPGETPDVGGDFEVTGQFVARTFFDTEVAATIVETTGEVTVKNPLGEVVGVGPGFKLRGGWTVIADPNSSAVVQFDSGSQVIVRENSSLWLSSKENGTEINQFWGFLSHIVTSAVARARGDCYYQVRTPVACACVRGTEFSTEYSQVGLIGTATVDVQSGIVEVADRNGNTTVVTAGQQLTITDSVPRVTLVMPMSGYSFIQGITNILSWTAFDGAAGYLLELAVDPPGFSQPNSSTPEFPEQTAMVMPGEFNQSDGLVEWPVLELPNGLPPGPQVQWRIFPVDEAGDILPETTSSDAYVLVNYGNGQDIASLPPHLDSYTYSGNTGFWVWDSNTSDVRALAPPSGNRVAATAYSNGSFSLALSAADTTVHTLALYFVDFDSFDRSQTVTLYDAVTDEVLDQRPLADFHGGVYYTYEVQDSIRVELTRTGGDNAVLSGVFWDEVVSPTTSSTTSNVTVPQTTVSFLSADFTTQGEWPGVYGSEGYILVNYGGEK